MRSNSSEKLCSHCGKWSSWNQHEDGNCVHCGSKLSNMLEKQKIREENFKKQNFGVFQIDPGENQVLKFFKKSTNLVVFAFISFVSFILWIISTIAP